MGILIVLRCVLGPNLEVLTWIVGELWHPEWQNEVNNPNFDFDVKFDLEGQGQSTPQTIPSLTKVFCTFGPNLVILTWTSDKLSRWQAHDWRTDGRTDGRTDRQRDGQTKNWLVEVYEWHKNIQKHSKTFKMSLNWVKHPINNFVTDGQMDGWTDGWTDK